MRTVIAVPVCGLLAGAAIGVAWPTLPAWLLGTVSGGLAGLSIHAFRVRANAMLVTCVSGAFVAGGVALAVDAWSEAWRPSLRAEFERLARAQSAASHTPAPSQPADVAAAVLVDGVLREDAAVTSSGNVSLSVRVEHLESPDGSRVAVDGGALLTVAGTLALDQMASWRAGRRVRATTELRVPGRFLDPGVPDQARALARRGTVLVGVVKSGALVDPVEPGTRVSEWAAAARTFARSAVRDAVGPWSAQSSAIVTAILIGDRTGLDADVERRLQEAGTYHVIAISGGNVAILAAVTLAMFRVAGLLGRGAMLAAAGGLVSYGYVVGGGASVTRATTMAAIYFLGRACDQRGPPMHTLLLVSALMTLADPLSVVDPATLLTFGATAAIVTVAGAVPAGMPRVLMPAVTLLLASAAAEAALMPVAATLFQRVTFAGLVLNFGAIPLMGLAQLAGMTAVTVDGVWPAGARIAGLAAHAGAEGLVRSADLVRFVPWVTWRVVSPPVWAIAMYYAGGVGAWVFWRRRSNARTRAGPVSARTMFARRTLAVAAIVAALWILAQPRPVSAGGDGRLHVTFIDVGQGDAALVRFPRGSSMLIDAGGLGGRSSYDVGDRIVGPVLRHFGVGRLDGLVLTHGDTDHIGGALTVLREFRPWDVWDGVPVPPSEALRRLREESLARRVRWTTVQRSDSVSIDGVQVFVRHPGVPDWERQDVRNDDSIVVELRWQDVSFVFTGDIGRDVERELVPLFARVPLRILKVPHHGSATSSSDVFVRALAPDVAVASVGRGNPFGHPSPAVLDRYRAAGTALYRTDQDGAVTVTTDGTSIDLESFTGRRLRLNQPRSREGHEGSHR